MSRKKQSLGKLSLERIATVWIVGLLLVAGIQRAYSQTAAQQQAQAQREREQQEQQAQTQREHQQQHQPNPAIPQRVSSTPGLQRPPFEPVETAQPGPPDRTITPHRPDPHPPIEVKGSAGPTTSVVEAGSHPVRGIPPPSAVIVPMKHLPVPVAIAPPRIPLRQTLVAPGGALPPRIAPRLATTAIVAPASVQAAPVRVVAAPSVTEVLALGSTPPVVAAPSTALAQAQMQVQAAEITCAQANAFSDCAHGQADNAQQLNQGIDQMLQVLADNASDPDKREALLGAIGQPDPINDALQQQLRNFAAVGQNKCITQMASAKAALAAAQTQSTQGRRA